MLVLVFFASVVILKFPLIFSRFSNPLNDVRTSKEEPRSIEALISKSLPMHFNLLNPSNETKASKEEFPEVTNLKLPLISSKFSNPLNDVKVSKEVVAFISKSSPM